MDTTLSLRAARDDDHCWLVHFLPQLETGDPLPDHAQFLAQYRHRFFLYGATVGDPVGCAVLDVLANTGYVRIIAVDPPHRGRGVGRALMREVAALLRARGCTQWCLNVKPENVPAVQLYEGLGMRKAYASRALRLAWDAVPRLPPPARDVRYREIGAQDDAAIEARWSLPGGQIAGWRQLPGQFVVGLFEVDGDGRDGACVGFGRANPGHPGLFPFRVAETSLARALLEGARPLFEQAGAVVSVVIEDDDALADVLLAHGAEPKMRIDHMRGVIPE